MLSLLLAASLGGLELQWDAPAQCPSQEQLQSTLEAALAEDESAWAQLQVRGVVRPGPDGLLLELTIDDGAGAVTHHAQSEACETLMAALEIQVLLAAAAAPPPKPKPAPLPEPEPEPEPEPKPKPAPL
ncbi:MAG: hypothetical protein KUG77_04310, partial [Nannocystaceae bacterium]|nr:hypothetical protein [Nannocystaceae bacterium]